MQNENDKVELQVEVNGRPIRVFSHDGRAFIESREDVTYALRLKNKTAHRILAVVGVDGINVISGKPISDKPTETGYVLSPHEEQVIKGYRIDNDTIAAFKFVKRGDSYATEKGEGQGNGVIAVRWFLEKNEDSKKYEEMLETWKKMERQKPEKEYIPLPYPVYTPPFTPPYRPWWESPSPYIYCSSSPLGTASTYGLGSTTEGHGGITTINCCATNLGGVARVLSSSTTSNASNSSVFEHGSSFGHSVKDTVKEVAFEPSSLLAESIIYYAPLEGLKELGVNVAREKEIAFPEPFKREYCSPPKGWTP